MKHRGFLHRSAARVLALALFAGAMPTKVSGQEVIAGTVFVDRNGNGHRDAGERGLRGVAVSNQADVVLTDSAGAYRLPGSGPTGVVFVSVPSGFAARTWYQRTPAGTAPMRLSPDFALAASPASTSVTFIHASDTHIAEASVPRIRRLRALVDSIRPSFVIITGDLVKDALRVGESEATGYYDLFQREIVSDADTQHFHLARQLSR